MRHGQKARSRCTKDGTDTDHGADQRVCVPSEPLPAWVLARRQAIGDQIRAAREGHQPWISQETLGELVGVDRKTINRIEQGAYATSVDSLIRIADALDVPLADLVR